MFDQASTASGDPLTLLKTVVGVDGFIVGDAAKPYYTDVFRALSAPLAVLRPATVEDLQLIVEIAGIAGLAMFPRGGGASYTDGYLPTTPQSIVVDTGRLNRILAINEIDSTVTVEAGTTWAALKEVLDPRGLRTPFFGPFSGIAATVGGSVSQNTVSHGSGAHGISAQSVISMDVVLASGEVLRTTAGNTSSTAFTRYYGPDLTGLFTGDCGTLGIKARITLPLLRRKPDFEGLSFSFSNFNGVSEAIRCLAQERLDDEHFALDAALSRGQIARQDAKSVLKAARSVFASSRNPLAAAVQLTRMALAGTRDLANSSYALHIIIDGISRGEVAARAARVRELMHAGQEIANTIPVLVRGMPFAPLFNTLGPAGERWVPVHGILPHSRVAGFHAALTALYADLASEMQQHGVWVGGMFMAVGTSGFLYEVALYWPGIQTAYHHAVIPAGYLANLPTYPDNPDVTEFILKLKQKLVELFETYGAAHFQVGRMYPYKSSLTAPASSLLMALKKQLDPKGLINPGVLGLDD